MGKLILHTGSSDSYYFFKPRILKYLKSDRPEIFIYLLPVNRAVRYLKKQLTYDAINGILVDPNVYTFSSLMFHIYKKLPQQKKLISNSMRLVLVNHILNEVRSELEFFKTSRTPDSGLVGKIDQMLAEFCEFGYRPNDFAFAPITAPEKYHDFARLLSSLYQEYNNQLIDESAMILEIVDSLDVNMFRKIFPKVEYIYINGYGIYTPPMVKFINKVRDWCEINVKLDYNSQNKALFKHTNNAFDALSQLAHEINTSQEYGDILSNKLFNTVFPILKKEEEKTKFYLQKTRDRKQEIAFIATHIRQCFQKKHIPLHEIGVTFPDIEAYAELIHTIFDEYEIPYNLSTGFALTQSPLIKSFLQVLKIVVNGFRPEDINDLLVSPFIHISPADNARIVNELKCLQGDKPA